jgi:hypothetical protein
MASERDLKELQDQQDRCRQGDHLNREREENDLHHKTPEEMQELIEKLQKELAEKDTQLADKDKVIEQLHSSLTSNGKTFDG